MLLDTFFSVFNLNGLHMSYRKPEFFVYKSLWRCLLGAETRRLYFV